MKKTLGTIAAAAAVVLLTATFCFAEYAAGGVGNFPYFQLGCLIIGGLILVSLKRKYEPDVYGRSCWCLCSLHHSDRSVHQPGDRCREDYFNLRVGFKLRRKEKEGGTGHVSNTQNTHRAIQHIRRDIDVIGLGICDSDWFFSVPLAWLSVG